MGEPVTEKRRYPRINGHFVVSYLEQDGDYKFDISQAKNVSAGGVLLTSCKQFAKETCLALKIRLPFISDPVASVGRVLESREVIKGVVYDTRLQFTAMEESDKSLLREALEKYLTMRNRFS